MRSNSSHDSKIAAHIKRLVWLTIIISILWAYFHFMNTVNVKEMPQLSNEEIWSLSIVNGDGFSLGAL